LERKREEMERASVRSNEDEEERKKKKPKLEGSCLRVSDMNDGNSLIMVPNVVSAPPMKTVCRSPGYARLNLNLNEIRG